MDHHLKVRKRNVSLSTYQILISRGSTLPMLCCMEEALARSQLSEDGQGEKFLGELSINEVGRVAF